MTFERHLSLREAERITGIGRHTLRMWLEQDLGLVFKPVSRGSKFLILERDLEAVLRKREGRAAPLPLTNAHVAGPIDGDELVRMSQEGAIVSSSYAQAAAMEGDSFR